MDLKALHDLADQVKPVLECLAIIAGATAIVKWIWERNNRATDVLLELEKEFESKCKHGRALVEQDTKYKELAKILAESVRTGKRAENAASNPGSQKVDLQMAIDDFLRFYVVLVGVRIANQVPERSLSICYRFWMAHYFRHDRKELREYINIFFPTLKKWLLNDICWFDRFCYQPFSTWWHPFFRPEDFWERKDFEKDPRKLATRR